MQFKNSSAAKSGVAFCVLIAGATLTPQIVKGGDVLPITTPAYHLVEDETHAAVGALTCTGTAPQLAASEFLLYAAKAPECASQSQVTSALSVKTPVTSKIEEVGEGRGGDGRRLLRARCAVASPAMPSTFSATVNYKATLHARHLAPGASPLPVAPLAEVERKRYTQERYSVDFTSSAFQKWLTDNHLHRLRDESDIALGRRALTQIAALYEYDFIEDQDRRISNLVGVKKTDCGGAANLFVGVMRANNIAARTLVGRWAEDKTPTNPVVTHVKAECFISGVGWVPVEAAGAIINKNIDATFGRDNGRFLVFHIDEDVVIDTVYWKPERTPFVQSILQWATGAGTFKDYKETEEWKASAK